MAVSPGRIDSVDAVTNGGKYQRHAIDILRIGAVRGIEFGRNRKAP
jgi:hypothetical protein